MEESKIESMSDDFFNLMLFLHKNLFNPSNLYRSACIPASHVKVLLFLAKKEKASASEIADSLLITRSNMTPIIDSLLEKKLVTKYPSPSDKRYSIVELTGEGCEFIKNQGDAIKTQISELFESLSIEDKALLARSISDMQLVLSRVMK